MAEFEGFNEQRRKILLDRMPQYLEECSNKEIDDIYKIFASKMHKLVQKRVEINAQINKEIEADKLLTRKRLWENNGKF